MIDLRMETEHNVDDYMGLDLEGHLNRDHSYRLTDLMGKSWEEKKRLHALDHLEFTLVEVLNSNQGDLENRLQEVRKERTILWVGYL